ncbi:MULTISPECIES: spore coat protein GerQ [Metabacillus]|uniref:Spore coat protein GerQ n=2 Tax=Metabacillus TaxID=2675233 RepID=A0A179T387_9BACI|nr:MULTISPECIES: spore coat protein GerQ [Metabacillus]OAS88566.1 spore coat protein GerQ [Metabacillus litoralis]QNF30451.1 spore coat protein GerQ [Metabacillus sp. KUDC1714]
MTCGDYNYYPMNYYPGFYPPSMTRASSPQQPGGFPATMPSGPSFAAPVVPIGTGQQLLAGVMEESFIENILRFNKGKVGTFYFTYQGNNKWNAMVYRGRVETAGRDHIIISDPSSGKRFLLMMANLDWVEFDEQINYPQAEINPEVQASMTTSE